MWMSVYLCVSVSLGLRHGIVSFSEMQMVTLNRPEPPCRSGCSVMMSVTGLCVCLCALGKEEQRFGVCDPSQPRGFSGGVQVTLEVEDASRLGMIPKGVKSPPHRVPMVSLGPPSHASGFLPERHPPDLFCPKGDTPFTWARFYPFCACALAHAVTQLSYPLAPSAVHTPVESPHSQTQLPSYSQIAAKALPARYLSELVK